jgi:hypothetical protein
MHLRPPSIDHGITSFLWGFGLGLFIWLGQLSIGIDMATAFILSALAGCAIFLFVRRFGEDEPSPPQATRSRERGR